MSLGKGLGALIAPTGGRIKTVLSTGDNATSTNRIWMVPVADVIASPDQPRKYFSVAELQELATSIKEHGILQPLLVAEQLNGGYELIAGERRLRAAKLAGLPTVPVIVKKLADSQKLEVALIENIQRENLNPIEEAFAYKRLIEEFGKTQQQVAEQVGKSRPAIANAIRLLELPSQVQTALVEAKISTGQARALLTLQSEKEQLDMLHSMLGQKITVRELEREGAKRKDPQNLRRDANLIYLEDKLRSTLGTKVSIHERGGRGTISIDFYSKEELSQLVKKISP